MVGGEASAAPVALDPSLAALNSAWLRHGFKVVLQHLALELEVSGILCNSCQHQNKALEREASMAQGPDELLAILLPGYAVGLVPQSDWRAAMSVAE